MPALRVKSSYIPPYSSRLPGRYIPARMAATPPRIALIHALRDSVEPAMAAMARGWPEARIANILDDSLSADLARAGRLDDAMTARFVHLASYAVDTGADAILFTCSAFGPAIEAARAPLAVPVLKPNESAFAAALATGSRIAILVTFEGSLAPLAAELRTQAGRRDIEVTARLVPGALAALQRGDGAAHDAAIAEAAAALPPCDALVLGQFSMARAADAVRGRTAATVLTTPDSAVQGIRRAVEAR